MRRRPTTTGLASLTGAACLALLLPGAAAAAPAAPSAPVAIATATPTVGIAPGADRTSLLEAARVDRVPTPQLGWYSCYFGTAQCATAEVPLDYDEPTGATTTVAVLKVPARDPARRLGSLFINPGGPGGSSTDAARRAPATLSPGLLERFDVVGVDPRGVGSSDEVRCFPNSGVQEEVMARLIRPPVTPEQEAKALGAAEQFGRACSTTGQPLASSMSTADVARDMDVVRRAVGDDELTYLGFSYGTYLGQVYANMFPDRVRALAIDGVIDPVAWAGTPATAGTPVDSRLASAEGTALAFREVLERCDEAGGTACAFATGDPVANFELIARRLKAAPVEIPTEFGPGTYDYQDLQNTVVGELYDSAGAAPLTKRLAELLVLTEPPAERAPAAVLAQARRSLTAGLRAEPDRPARYDFPYQSDDEAFTAVLCTDTLNPADPSAWPVAAEQAERDVPHFGRYWAWQSAPCAERTWTARNEDAYRGPFTARTAAPVLVVGASWDPATPYSGAVAAARLLPGSRLLTSDNFGHTSFGTSACVTDAVTTYLVDGTLPPIGQRCVGDEQPFTAAAAPVAPGDPATATATATAPTQGLRARRQLAVTVPAGWPVRRGTSVSLLAGAGRA